MIALEPFERALSSLDAALVPPPANDRERDGAIQRFEYTFELMWKTGKRFLAELGIEALSPKAVIRAMAQQGWIADADRFFTYLKAKNYTAHTYEESTANWVFSQALAFSDDCHHLLELLRSS